MLKLSISTIKKNEKKNTIKCSLYSLWGIIFQVINEKIDKNLSKSSADRNEDEKAHEDGDNDATHKEWREKFQA